MAEKEVHLAALNMPAMSAEDYATLVESIQRDGQLVPIELLNGRVIDGVHRLRACTELGVEPVFIEVDLDPDMTPGEYVWALNGARRHLTPSQRAAAAVDLLPELEERARERQLAGLKKGKSSVPEIIPEREGDARDEAAKIVGVNPRYISDAKAIKEQAPEQFEKVRSGEKNLSQVIREERAKELKSREIVLPEGQYRVLYADPPWKYGDPRAVSDNNGLSYKLGAAEDHYPAMSIAELEALPVKDLAADDAVLFMWVTSPLLESCFSVIRAWGFRYKASFVWDKVRQNMGHYNSVRHELLLICTRGRCTPDVPQQIDSVQSIERTEHSKKPEEFRQFIDSLYPRGPRLELFARRPADGWETWGNECH